MRFSVDQRVIVNPRPLRPTGCRCRHGALARTLNRDTQGRPTELAVIADELSRSAKSLVHHAPVVEVYRPQHGGEGDEPEPLEKVAAYANDILLLIANKRFCREIVLVPADRRTPLRISRESHADIPF